MSLNSASSLSTACRCSLPCSTASSHLCSVCSRFKHPQHRGFADHWEMYFSLKTPLHWLRAGSSKPGPFLAQIFCILRCPGHNDTPQQSGHVQIQEAKVKDGPCIWDHEAIWGATLLSKQKWRQLQRCI